jgi:Bacterial Ig domain/Glycosyl hydrolase family 26
MPRNPLSDQKPSIPLSATARSLLVLSAFVASLIAADAAAAARYVAIVSPPRGATVSRTVRWSATARPRPRRIEFRVDGRLVRIDRTAPYVYRWDTTRVRNGYHRLSVRAVRRVRSTTTSLTARRRVKVRNPKASFFTGPAGTNILLPPNGAYPSNGAFIGITPGGPGVTYEQSIQDTLDLESYIGRKFHIIQRMSGGCSFPTPTAKDMVSRGWIFMTSWQWHPYLRDVFNGSQDACITQYAQGAAAWGQPFFLRIWWEFNGDWHQSSYYEPGVLATPEQHRDAWRYVVNKMKSAGLTKASFVWAPGEGHYGNGDFDEQLAYPGDAYVDWVGVDGYNFGRSFDWCGGGPNPSYQGWCPLEYVLHDRLGPGQNIEEDFRGRKPYIVAETGSNEGQPGQKGQWFIDGIAAIKANFPGMYGFVYFNINAESDGCCNWRVDTSQSSLDGFKVFATDPFWKRL